MVDNSRNISDPLFCEWVYVIDTDENVLSIHTDRGTQGLYPGRYGKYRTEHETDRIVLRGIPLAYMISLDKVIAMTEDEAFAIMEKLQKALKTLERGMDSMDELLYQQRDVWPLIRKQAVRERR
ncbi:hypothetical protein KIPB_010776 [Kipferlia bialata]|uniref:Uncharacterized protein n=1 Tax=Kipferlia bialata TaxID=797122 RepID=A0A9K3GMU1_9EUKA|nr:hypothetical protein KIPB_010776 [Kipferlia bialata]|eukprot:g10776.t1